LGVPQKLKEIYLGTLSLKKWNYPLLNRGDRGPNRREYLRNGIMKGRKLAIFRNPENGK